MEACWEFFDLVARRDLGRRDGSGRLAFGDEAARVPHAEGLEDSAALPHPSQERLERVGGVSVEGRGRGWEEEFGSSVWGEEGRREQVKKTKERSKFTSDRNGIKRKQNERV